MQPGKPPRHPPTSPRKHISAPRTTPGSKPRSRVLLPRIQLSGTATLLPINPSFLSRGVLPLTDGAARPVFPSQPLMVKTVVLSPPPDPLCSSLSPSSRPVVIDLTESPDFSQLFFPVASPPSPRRRRRSPSPTCPRSSASAAPASLSSDPSDPSDSPDSSDSSAIFPAPPSRPVLSVLPARLSAPSRRPPPQLQLPLHPSAVVHARVSPLPFPMRSDFLMPKNAVNQVRECLDKTAARAASSSRPVWSEIPTSPPHPSTSSPPAAASPATPFQDIHPAKPLPLRA